MNEGLITNGSLSLLKISRSSFDDFKYRYEEDGIFQSKIMDMVKSEIRDKKIDDIFDDLD